MSTPTTESLKVALKEGGHASGYLERMTRGEVAGWMQANLSDEDYSHVVRVARELDRRFELVAIRVHGDGTRELVSCCETLGHTYGMVYTRAEAEAEAVELRATWDDSWDLGPCPSYELQVAS